MGQKVNITQDKKYPFAKLGMQVGFIFALPVAIVFFAGHMLHINVLYLLPISFVTSWVLTFLLYKKTKKHFDV